MVLCQGELHCEEACMRVGIMLQLALTYVGRHDDDADGDVTVMAGKKMSQ
jgi:hypothetical protein